MKTKLILAITALIGMILFGILAVNTYPSIESVFSHMGVVWGFLTGFASAAFTLAVYLLNRKEK